MMARSARDEARRVSFDARAEEYRHARPAYPAAIYDLLADHCGLGPGARVLEIGPGTGQATRELLARGAEVVAVEPGVRLAAVLAADLAGDRLTIVNDRVETAPLTERAFDLVASATAFHWVQAPVALPRLARCLREGGWLAVWWTEFGDETRPTAFRTTLDELYVRYLPAQRRPRVRRPLNIDSWCDELSQGGHFTRPEVTRIGGTTT
jgi:SAM-dependent methyltransferase